MSPRDVFAAVVLLACCAGLVVWWIWMWLDGAW